MITLLLPLIALGALKQAGPVLAIDEGSGLAVEFPQAPVHASADMNGIVMSRYMAKGADFGFIFAVYQMPDQDRYLDTRGLDYLDQHVSQFIPGTITRRGPAMFGPCRGFYYGGSATISGETSQFSARFFQLGTCWVLMEAVGSTNPDDSRDVADYYASLQMCMDGKPPVGDMRSDDVVAKMRAGIDADLTEDSSIDSDQPGGTAYGFIKSSDMEQILFRSLEFDDTQRAHFLSQATINKAQGQIEDFLKMTETKDRSFRIGPYSGKEFEMENSDYHARARLFGFGNRRYLIVYESRGPLDDEKADHVLNSFRIDFSKRDS